MSPMIGQVISPIEAMRLAIQEGHRGAGFVAPNPLVGCAIVDSEHRLLALGYHAKLGEAHAEAHALAQIADLSRVRGGHVYVSLEPCAHQGRTPSCARTLAPLHPASVTYAILDPNPLVAGKGAEILREAGVEAWEVKDRSDWPEEAREELIELAEELAEVFLHNFRSQKPFVAIKVAASLDGQLAYESGESQWITGPQAREKTHLLRAQYDAVLIGANTFVTDNPSLNVRHANYPEFTNQVVVLDPTGRTLEGLIGSNLIKTHSPDRVLVVTGDHVKQKNPAGVKVLQVPLAPERRFVIGPLLETLRREKLTSVMVEGGASTFGAFFDSGYVNRVHVFLAPVLMGGKHGLGWSEYFGGQSMRDKIQLDRSVIERVGNDVYWTARVRWP